MENEQEQNNKRTGLGGSLLLQRTDPQPPVDNPVPFLTPERPERFDIQPEPVRQVEIKKPQELRDRCTLYLDRDVNTQLDLVARIERRQRSEVVTEILRDNLPKYRIDRE
jgi:hypothetical protein